MGGAFEQQRGMGGTLESVHIFRAGGGRMRKKSGQEEQTGKRAVCCPFPVSTLQMGQPGLRRANDFFSVTALTRVEPEF